jgi:hypothetical protein
MYWISEASVKKGGKIHQIVNICSAGHAPLDVPLIYWFPLSPPRVALAD